MTGRLDDANAAVASDAQVIDTKFSDAHLTDTVVKDLLGGRYRWAPGMELPWRQFDGQRWLGVKEEKVREKIRLWAVRNYQVSAQAVSIAAMQSNNEGETNRLKEIANNWFKVLGKTRLTALVDLAGGHGEILTDAGEFDSDPDILNTPDGVIDYRESREAGHIVVKPHDPSYLITHITSGRYREGFTHPDVEAAKSALPEDKLEYLGYRLGVGVTGHHTPDGVNVILQGGGENGKGALVTDGVVPAFGAYATMASYKLINDRNEHSTEMADLRGKRLVIAEELTEKNALNTTALKRISDVSRIKARHTHKDNIEFKTTHTLMATTNPVPRVVETDHGTWRRLSMVCFPYTFQKTAKLCVRDTDRVGDPALKMRIQGDESGQHDALLTWVVDHTLGWYIHGAKVLAPPESVESETQRWRMSADRILSFWQEMLVADPGCQVSRADVLVVFNRWLLLNEHQAWAKETFHTRFATHPETTRYGITVGKMNVRQHLVRADGVDDGPKRPLVYSGLRFRRSDDEEV